jgi:hypothetical protein
VWGISYYCYHHDHSDTLYPSRLRLEMRRGAPSVTGRLSAMSVSTCAIHTDQYHVMLYPIYCILVQLNNADGHQHLRDSYLYQSKKSYVTCIMPLHIIAHRVRPGLFGRFIRPLLSEARPFAAENSRAFASTMVKSARRTVFSRNLRAISGRIPSKMAPYIHLI